MSEDSPDYKAALAAVTYDSLKARIRDWQLAMGQPLQDPKFPTQQFQYVREEWDELLEAQLYGTLKDEVDAIGDIAFTLVGLENAGGPSHVNKAWFTLELICGQRGFSLAQILERICDSNETKLWTEEDALKTYPGGVDSGGHIVDKVNGRWVVRGAYTNKVVKPPTYKAPDFTGII
jgi:hypothetical protein